MIIRRVTAFLNKIANNLWPIYRHELSKFIPMSILIFCILLNQNILKILKDSIIISEIGAEATSFIKVYCVTPVALFFVLLYTYLVNKFSFEQIYRYLMLLYIAFLATFAFVVYPQVDYLHMNQYYTQELITCYPYLKWYIALAANWSYVIFYVLSELWPNIFYSLLFWQLANRITTTEQAGRFYMLFSLFGNSALIFTGIIIMNSASNDSGIQQYFSTTKNNIVLIQTAIAVVLISAVLTLFLVRFICASYSISSNLQTDTKHIIQENLPRLSLRESFKYIISSRYLWLILICTASFGFTVHLLDATWKAQIKEVHTTTNEYAKFVSICILCTGLVIPFMTIIGRALMSIYGWFAVAIITPIIITTSGILFFILITCNKVVLSMLDFHTVISPITVAIMIGAIQNAIVKGARYSIWDTSKEMLYIPLDNELKTKGKAAVDVISAKIGKSSSGFIVSLIFTLFPTASYTSIAPALMFVFMIVCTVWIFAVKKINVEYKKII